MASGFTFDMVLVALILVLAVWEIVIAVRKKEKKRFILVVLAIVAAGVLLWLRSPQIFG